MASSNNMAHEWRVSWLCLGEPEKRDAQAERGRDENKK